MKKQEFMKFVEGYIVDGSFTYEEVRKVIVNNLNDFSNILEEHQFSIVEFHSILPFIKVILVYASRKYDDEEIVNRFYYAIRDCQEYYKDSMTETPMHTYIDMIFDLFKSENREDAALLNSNIELLTFAILQKSNELIKESKTK